MFWGLRLKNKFEKYILKYFCFVEGGVKEYTEHAPPVFCKSINNVVVVFRCTGKEKKRGDD